MDKLKELLNAELASCGEETEKISAYFKRYAPRPDEEIHYAQFALERLNTLTDKDSYLTIAGLLKWLDSYGTPDLLPQVKEMRKILPPRPGLRDYRIDADELITTLESKANGICECKAKIGYNTPPWIDLFETISSEVNQESYSTKYLVRCKKCNAEHAVEQQEGYHYPVFNWQY